MELAKSTVIFVVISLCSLVQFARGTAIQVPEPDLSTAPRPEDVDRSIIGDIYRMLRDQRTTRTRRGHRYDPLASASNGAANAAGVDPACPDCVRRKDVQARMSKQELDRKRIEVIKTQILYKLRMKAAPNITTPLEQLPEPIADTDDIDYATVVRGDRATEDKASEVYIFPDGGE